MNQVDHDDRNEGVTPFYPEIIPAREGHPTSARFIIVETGDERGRGLKGKTAFYQDCELDGTPTKSRLGANAILGVSLAVAKAAAMPNSMIVIHMICPLTMYAKDWVLNFLKEMFRFPLDCLFR